MGFRLDILETKKFAVPSVLFRIALCSALTKLPLVVHSLALGIGISTRLKINVNFLGMQGIKPRLF